MNLREYRVIPGIHLSTAAVSRLVWTGLVCVATLALAGCIHTESDVKVQPIEIKPIEMTLNVNIRVQKEVDHTMDYLYGGAAPGETPTTKP